MDDVYNGWLQDFESELGIRLQKEILEPIGNSQLACYKKYDWYQQEFNSIVDVPRHPYLILEGVGACNQVIAGALSFQIWIAAKAEVLIERIIERDGEAMRPHLAGFKTREAIYFNNHVVKQRADLQLSGD